MYLVNHRSGLKLLSFILFMMLTIGWVITPAQAGHCKGQHRNDPGCDGGGGGDPTPPSLANSAIVYVAKDGINVADADGGNQASLLIRRNTSFWFPSWSPDGNFILFASDLNGPGIYSMMIVRNSGLVEAPNLIISLNTVITKAAWSPVPTADGKYKIAYTDYDNEFFIYLVNVSEDGVPLGPPFRLSPLNGPPESFPSWSPDASKLAVDKYNALLGSHEIEILEVGTDCGDNGPRVCEVPGTRRNLIAELPSSPFNQYGAWGPSWANKGNKIAVNGIPKQASNLDVWIIEFDTDPANTNFWNLTNTNSDYPPDRNENSATWSPDDSQIMYQAWDYLCQPQTNKERGYNLIIRNVEGTHFPPAEGCEEKMIVPGGRMPNWWRNAPIPPPPPAP